MPHCAKALEAARIIIGSTLTYGADLGLYVKTDILSERRSSCRRLSHIAGAAAGHSKYVAEGKAKGDKATLVRVMFGILQFLIVLGAILVILQMNGVSVNSVVTGLGLLSAIVGFSLQDVLKDIFMVIHIISDHFFSVGDVVKYQDIEGEVIGFTIKTTTLGIFTTKTSPRYATAISAKLQKCRPRQC